ncbi:hypothetical protein Cgig2_027389 [Carnegiea gigantea]|uniref:Uncharacterized protein n=1 Tax=Carnegiea gigantea TaxID=171969 RepID=A0A9Q1K4P8_9CARY|nr:hypothetical protein Cgig2_027389 [Carnegiea gigantea]
MVCFPNFTSTKMAAEYIRDTFWWPLREASARCPNPLPADHHGLCPSFDLGVATQYAQNSNGCMKDGKDQANILHEIPDELLAEGTQGLIPEILSEGPEFPGAPARSDPQDGPGINSPNPKVVPTLKRTTLEKKYLIPAGYSFVILEANATVNKLPAKCIAVYRAALNYDLRCPLHLVIKDILNKYELALRRSCLHPGRTFAQVMPTSWPCAGCD